METRKYIDAFDQPETDTLKSPNYDDSPLIRYERGKLESFKKIVTEILSVYIEKHRSTLTNIQLEELQQLISHIGTSQQYEAVYTHLAIAANKFQDLPNLTKMIKHVKNYPLFLRDARHAKYGAPKKQDEADVQKYASVYHNNVDASIFESELALAILHSAPKTTSEKVNKRIIDYCERHKERILVESGDDLKYELIKYHICTESDFETKNPVDVFIALLNRPLSNPVIAAELASLHLVFFNYNHIYKPERDAPNEYVINDITHDRESVHRQVRPKEIGQMFEPETRGRAQIISSQRSSEFGITTPEQLPEWARDWHRIKYTPHKYRAGLHLTSDILQEFRKHNAPYIAGPSGTTADCMEGLHFLMPGMTKEEIKEYYNLLAAAEVGFGHHSMNEIILPLCNLELYEPHAAKIRALTTAGRKAAASKMSQQPWHGFDFVNSYEAFLSTEFKKSDQYKALAIKYPHYFAPERNQIENMTDALYHENDKSIVASQRFQRAHTVYKELSQGTYWREAEKTMGMEMNLESFTRLSKENLTGIQTELGNLTPEEKAFYYHLMGQSTEITHYTNATDIITDSGVILSNTLLHKILGKGNFTDNSDEDIAKLANGGNVFFRYELKHNHKMSSRFGEEHLIMKSETTPIFETGWVSLYDMLVPDSASIVRTISDEGNILRAQVGTYTHGKITYKYGEKEHEFDVTGTVFYGPDIRKGIALTMIRELRRIGGPFQEKSLKDLSPEAMNILMAKLFRIEAKIPGCVNMEKVSYRYTAPGSMWTAITGNNISVIQSIIGKGMPIDEVLSDGNTGLYLAAKSEKSYDAFVYLFEHGASIDNDKQSVAHIAALHGNVRALTYCLDHGINIDKKDSNNRSILSYALESAKINVIQCLLSKGASLTIDDIVLTTKNGHADILSYLFKRHPEIIPKCIAWRDGNENSLAHIAAQHEYYGILKVLIDNNIPINSVNKFNQTVLHVTATLDSPIPDNIIDAGKINIYQKDNEGNTILHLACIQYKHFDKYIRLGLDINEQNNSKMTPLTYFVESATLYDISRIYARIPIDFTKPDNDGYTLAHRVIIKGNNDAFRFIYQTIRSTELTNSITGESLLLCAINNKRVMIALELIEYGASPFSKNKAGVSAIDALFSINDEYMLNLLLNKMISKVQKSDLIEWIESLDKIKNSKTMDILLINLCLSHHHGDNTDIIEALLLAGANPHNIIDKTGTSTAISMVLSDNSDMLALFIKHGIDVNFHHPDNDCLLHLAIENDKSASINTLLDSDSIDPTVKNHHGKSAFDIAIEKSNIAVIDLMMSRGHQPDLKTIADAINVVSLPLLKTYIKYFPGQLFTKVENKTLFEICIDKSADVELCFLIKVAINENKTSELLKLIKETKDKNFYVGMLSAALEIEDLTLAKEILANCPDVNFIKESAILIKLAIEFNHYEIITDLLNAGVNPYAHVNPEMSSLNPHTALSVAIFNDDERALEMILSHDQTLNKDNAVLISKSLFSALNSPELVKILLKHGADTKYADESGRTALHEAAIGYSAKTIEALCTSAADINAVNNAGETPLHLAVNSNKVENVIALLKYHADPNIIDKYSETPLHTAIGNNANIKIIEALIEHGCDVNATSNDKETPLHYATRNSDVAIIEKLLSANANIEAEDADGITPLQSAIISNNMEVANFLLSKGTALNHINHEQYNVLHHMAGATELNENLNEIVLWIYEHNPAMFNARTTELSTPLHIAVEASNVAILQAFSQKEITCDYNAKDANGNTPLHIACQNDQLHLVKQLLKSGTVDVTIRNNKNKTIFDILDENATFGSNAILDELYHYAVKTNQIESVISNLTADNQATLDKLLYLAYSNKNFHLINLLLDKNANPNIHDIFGVSLLLNSIDNDYYAITEAFIRRNANMMITHGDHHIDAINLLCKSNGNISSIKYLFEQGSLITYLSKNGFTACKSALESQALDNFNFLFARSTLTHEQLNNLIIIAAKTDNIDILKILLVKTNDPNIYDTYSGVSLLETAIRNSSTSCINYLLSHENIDINAKSGSGQSLVELALSSCPANVALSVISKIGVNTQFSDGNTCVHLAMMFNRPDILEYLQLSGEKIDFTIANNAGKTAILLAIEAKRTHLIQNILRHPSNINLQIDSSGNTIFHYANNFDHDTLRDLSAMGNNPNIENALSLTPLLLEIKKNTLSSLASIRTLISCGADVNQVNKYGFTPLSTAALAYNTDPAIINELLTSGSDLSIESDDNLQNIMHNILLSKNNALISNFYTKVTLPIFNKLITYTNEDKDEEDAYYEQLAVLAIKSNNIEMLKSVIDRIDDIDTAIDTNNNTLLEKACATPNIDPKIISLLLKLGANPNGVGSFESTALIESIKSQTNEVTLLLLNSKDIKINSHDSDNLRPIHHAIKQRNSEILQKLLEMNVEIRNIDLGAGNLLQYAIDYGMYTHLPALIAGGIDPFSENINGASALETALTHKSIEPIDSIYPMLDKNKLKSYIATNKIDTLVITRLMAGAIKHNDVDILNEIYTQTNRSFKSHAVFNLNPLIFAAKYGQAEVFAYMLENGYKANIVDTNLSTPLHHAVASKNYSVVALLITESSLLEQLDGNNKSAVEIAIEMNDPEMTALLLSNLENKNVINPVTGDNLYFLAIKHQSTSVIPILAALGVDVNSTTTDVTPICYAAKYDNTPIIVSLINAGAELHPGSSPPGQSALDIMAKKKNTDALTKAYEALTSTKKLEDSISHLVKTESHETLYRLYLIAQDKHDEKIQNAIMTSADVKSFIKLAAADNNATLINNILKDDKADVFITDDHARMHAIQIAMANNADDALNALLTNQALPDISDSIDSTNPTLSNLAIQASNHKLLDIILDHGADPNYKDSTDTSLLQLAMMHHDHSCVSTLLKHDANPLQPTSEGLTPLEYAIELNDWPIIINLLMAIKDYKSIDQNSIYNLGQIKHELIKYIDSLPTDSAKWAVIQHCDQDNKNALSHILNHQSKPTSGLFQTAKNTTYTELLSRFKITAAEWQADKQHPSRLGGVE